MNDHPSRPSPTASPPETDAGDGGSARRLPSLAIIGQQRPVQGAAPLSRRGFVQLVGTGVAMTGAVSACTRPRQKIVPFVRRPPEVTPGNPLHFATALSHEGYGFGVLVESHAGRPTKIEGNPDHPDSLGAAGVADQAYLLGLYDTDRDAQLRHRGEPATWTQVLGHVATLTQAHARDGGARLRFLVDPETSPLLGDLRARILARFPAARFVTYSALADSGVAGAQLAFGRALEPRHDLTGARVILALDADFLGDGPESVRLTRQFAAGREPGATMNRLYVAEPALTVTGAAADHRLRVRGSEIVAVAQRLVVELAALLGREVLGPLADLPMAEAHANLDDAWIKAVARDLASQRGKGLILAGRRQPAAVQALVHAANYALGNLGAQLRFVAPIRHDVEAGPEALAALAAEIDRGAVDTLVVTAANPVYTAPADLDLAARLGKVANTIYLGQYEDETAAAVKTFVPGAHPLESWGDLRALDGTVTLVQPLIEPLFSKVTGADLLAAFLGEGDRGAHALLRAYWEKRAAAEGRVPAGSTFDQQWEHWLARGVVERTAVQPEGQLAFDVASAAPAIGGSLSTAGGKSEGVELAFAVDSRVGDGRLGNNAWLHELPHPISKVTWDNAVMLSQATAARLGLRTGDWAQLTLGARSVRGPVFVQPGLADESVSVALGYGRQGKESVARGVGFDAGRLRTSAAGWFARGVTVEKIGSGYRFGISQDHPSDEGRQPVRVGTLSEVLDSHSEFHHGLEHNRGQLEWQIHPPVDYSKEQYKWAMSIDLTRCTGCGACVIACQSENNIPTVGREQVRIGREMHWIRIDRYYTDAPTYHDDKNKRYDDTRVVMQPIACQHCETAPCEYVCPVNATVHSDEGLNEMVYNRCVGTRYCSNNCPYKARRFNFLDFVGDPGPVRAMVHNPDVTVRARGVMEKCTYCVQRIERARIDARVEGRSIADGEIQTACQQTCAAQAIEFGSLNDAGSRVSRKHADARRYDLLHEIGTRPRTAYLARVRNPNPELG